MNVQKINNNNPNKIDREKWNRLMMKWTWMKFKKKKKDEWWLTLKSFSQLFTVIWWRRNLSRDLQWRHCIFTIDRSVSRMWCWKMKANARSIIYTRTCRSLGVFLIYFQGKIVIFRLKYHYYSINFGHISRSIGSYQIHLSNYFLRKKKAVIIF
jgi:hypothetical protein